MATLLQVLIPTAEDWSRSFNTVRCRNSGERERGSRLSHKQQGKCSHPHSQMLPPDHTNVQPNDQDKRRSMHYSPELQLPKLTVKCSHRRSLHLTSHASGSVGGDSDVCMKVRGALAQAPPMRPPLMGPANGPGKLPTRFLASG